MRHKLPIEVRPPSKAKKGPASETHKLLGLAFLVRHVAEDPGSAQSILNEIGGDFETAQFREVLDSAGDPPKSKS